MREILFRAKRIDTGEWIEGNYVSDHDGAHYITQPLVNTHRLVPVDGSTIGQFTGLHDKTGKKIFERDIVKCGTNKAGAVEYDPYEALYHVGNDPLQYYVYGSAEPETMRVEIEIIGNIHDKETSP